MSHYISNISQVIQGQLDKLNSLQLDKVARAMASAALPEMKRRVHVEGKDSNNSLIGSYTNSYLNLRTGNFKNSGRKTKGKNKGELKDAGVFTDRTIRLNKNVGVFTGEDKVGKARPKYNRDNDRKVVLSLTRQMENDEVIVPIDETSYGIGFNNKHNYDKSQWNEATYKKKIWDLTPEERAMVHRVAEEEAKNQLQS